ncbi:MAG: MoxR family ATPase [Saprospiraceae bacterium]|nr:MoxR family ATPase [Saprospiraceae bacterium]
MHKKENRTEYKGTALNEYKYGALPYFPGEEIVRAVNIALRLGRPLLVRGEPGCGKTRLAEAVAVELHGEHWKDSLFRWSIRSTTKASEGFYTFDHLARLRDSQIEARSYVQEQKGKKKEGVQKYINYGALGKAIIRSEEQPEGNPPVLLVDEIDKADIDLPNDLLELLEDYSFVVTETNDQHKSPETNRPFIIITSNNERELSDAFLRRCIFLWIDFPGEDLLNAIAEAIFTEQDDHWKKSLPGLIDKFQKIRDFAQKSPQTKHPSTSEMLDWLRAVGHYTDWGKNRDELDRILESRDGIYRETLIKTQPQNKR